MSNLNTRLSDEQAAIVSAFQNGTRHSIIKSPAGSGKTTTIGHCAHSLSPDRQSRALYLSYAKNNVTYASRYLPDAVAKRTFHSIGLAALRNVYPRLEVNENKYRWFAQDLLRSRPGLSWREQRVYQSALAQLVEMTQVEMGDPEDPLFYDYLVDRYGIETPFGPEEGQGWVCALLKRGHEELYRLASFSDMIYQPVRLQLEVGQWDTLFVDEAQDMNPARLAMTEMLVENGARLVAVGDEYQAIYGFTGSHTSSMEELKRRFDPEVYVQPVCFRCPKLHVRLAQKVSPYIKPSESSIEGRIVESDPTDMLLQWPYWTQEVLVLSRTKRPLVEAAWVLLKRGIPCYVRGTGIGEEMLRILDIATGYEDELCFDRVPYLLRAWLAQKSELLRARNNTSPLRVEFLHDQVESLLVCWEKAKENGCMTLKGFRSQVSSLFGESGQAQTGGKVQLSTIHGAKGEEAPVVVHLNPSDIPHPRATTELERQQEQNLWYVAMTRCGQKGHPEAGTLFLCRDNAIVDSLLV